MTAKAERWKASIARKAARDRVRDLRAALKEARKAKRERGRELRAECKRRRVQAREDAKQRRRDLVTEHRRNVVLLRNELARAREALSQSCTGDRAALRENVQTVRARLDAARRDLDWLRARKVPRGLRGLSPQEAREHERDEALNDVTGEAERALFLELWAARKIRSTPRRSLWETFWEYVHDHPHALSEKRNALEAEQLAQLERDEREAWQALKASKRRRPAPAVSAPVADEFGGW